ncbi:ATP-binding protein [Rhodococcus sp. NPDC019627]|uniref:ATP-binding protein n=1 Tax=unclassified Rhodococcus (in: high G+C Gram-positive bacteria) TaxID=192944 RepID=UPI0033C58569
MANSNDSAGLVALRAACDPREDVLSGGLADNHFAAQLDKVVRDADHYPVYGDPDAFFAQTYATSGLRTLLTKTFGRVTGAKGVAAENGVLRPTTSFGGGKTHGLTAVYHLAKGARPANLADFVDLALMPDGPVPIAALVGDALDPVAGVETNGRRTYTLWGEMAAQIGDAAFDALAASDQERTAPGTATLKEAFAGQPTIVIIDEIAKYIRQVTSSGSEDVRRMAKAIPVFLGNLFEVASDPTNNVSVIITLAAATNAFGEETTEMTDLLDDAASAASDAVAETSDVLTRAVQPSAVIKPADDTEIGEILKTRLFKTVDQTAARAAGDAYRDFYEVLGKTETLAGGPEQPVTYGDQVAKSYPFHPELVRVLDKRLGDIPQFQRARGALKLLAEVVAGIYRDGDDTAIINVGDIDYADAPVLNHLTDGLGRGEFSSVAIGDFAGSTSHAVSVDADVFPGKPHYATRVARTVFTHSLEMKSNAGAGRNDWLLGTLRPGEDATIFEKALTESEKVFWHLSFDGARWRFNVEPNVNAIIEAEKRNVANTRVASIVDDLIRRAFSNDGGVTAVHFPAAAVDVPDQASLRVAVLDYRVLSVNAKDADAAPSLLVEMLDKAGAVGSPRKYRNGVLFAVPADDQIDVLKDRARALIAADILAADTTRLSQFSAEVRKKIETYQKQASLEARIAVNRCYKHIYFPTNDKSNGHLRHKELPPQVQGDPKNATSAVIALLEDEGKIRRDSFTASFLRSKTWPKVDSVTTAAIVDYFWMDHASPIVRNVALLREAIANGIKNESWVYYDGATGKAYTAHAMAGMNVGFSSDAEIMTAAEAQNRGLLVRKPTQADLRAVLTGAATTGAEVRALLDAECGGEPSKADVLELLSAAVQASDYKWFVALDTDPAPGVRALSPSSLKEKGLDTLRIITRADADAAGVDVPTRTVNSKTFNASGPGGAAFQKLVDQIEDFTIRTVSRLTIKVTADEAKGTGDIDLAVIALGMLPKHAIIVKSRILAEYKNLTGGLQFTGTAQRADFQNAYGNVKKALSGATKIAGDMTLDVVFDPPVDIDSADVSQIHTVVKNLQIQQTTMSAEVTR